MTERRPFSRRPRVKGHGAAGHPPDTWATASTRGRIGPRPTRAAPGMSDDINQRGSVTGTLDACGLEVWSWRFFYLIDIDDRSRRARVGATFGIPAWGENKKTSIDCRFQAGWNEGGATKKEKGTKVAQHSGRRHTPTCSFSAATGLVPGGRCQADETKKNGTQSAAGSSNRRWRTDPLKSDWA